MTRPRPRPFRFKDCALTIVSLGRSAQNLRELRDGIAEVPIQSIAHHFYETLLRPSFDDPEYRNDFALWARRQLHDHVLAERLGAIEPLDHEEPESLRRQLLDVVEDRLSEVSLAPAAAAGHEFYFLRSCQVILDTGRQATTPLELQSQVPHLPAGSIYYHFIEARRRPPILMDDFSAWLRDWGPSYDRCRENLAAIDYHLWSLTEMRSRIEIGLRELPEAESRT